MSNQEIALQYAGVADLPVVSPENLKKQVSLIMDSMTAVMVPGVHYGIIPNTGDKPTLLKPGAEVLCLMFRLIPHFEETRVEMVTGHVEYRIQCVLKSPDGRIQGMGAGSCSTMESKYRYRKSERTCPSCGKPAIIKGKEQYGGGWLCYAKKGGCGEKFQDGDASIEEQIVGRVENADLADVYNTVLKMAQKRAQVDATLRATAASGIFTQDVEDLPDYLRQTAPKPEPERGPIVDAEYTQEEPQSPHPQGKKPAMERFHEQRKAEKAKAKPRPAPGSIRGAWFHILEGNTTYRGLPLCDVKATVLEKMVKHEDPAVVTPADREAILLSMTDPQGRLDAIDTLKRGGPEMPALVDPHEYTGNPYYNKEEAA